LEGLIFTALFNPAGPANPTAVQFFNLYAPALKQGKLGEAMTAFQTLGADTYLVSLDAFKRSGASQGTKLEAALASTKGFAGVSGGIKTGPDGNVIKSVTVLKVRCGELASVTTMNPSRPLAFVPGSMCPRYPLQALAG